MKKNKKLFLSAAACCALIMTACTSTPASSSGSSSVDSTPGSETSSVVTSSSSSTEAPEGAKVNVYEEGTPIDYDGGSAASYVGADYDERTEILGLLEEYAVDNHLTGLSLFENGGYVMYNERVEKGTETYISGYGFGISAEGRITADMEKETNTAWKRYYHTYQTDDPKTINYLNDQGSVVGDLYSYISSSYYGTRMNETKDGYEWYPVLAKDEIEPVNPDANGLASQWKIKVKTGEDGLVYNTLSTARSAYQNRPVVLDDYVTAFKLLLTQANNQYRGSELAAASGYASIQGAAAYYNASADGFNASAWEGVGIAADPSDNSITFTLGTPCKEFYARYGLSSSLYQPVPQAFIDEIGGMANYGNFIESGTSIVATPVDTILSCGPYVLERWDADSQIVFKNNDLWVEKHQPETEDLYQIEGYHFRIFPAQKTNTDAAFLEFLDGGFDSAGIPQTYLDSYKNDPRTSSTTGDSVFKLNMNTCDEETWEQLFGVNGSIHQTPSVSEYWECEPFMANSNFLNGLNASIDRRTYADNRGRIPSENYFSSNYLSNPEEGISYNTTEAHAKAIEHDYEHDGYGYSLEAAREYFRTAVAEEVEKGSYQYGTAENPTEVHIEICWMDAADAESFGNEIKTYLENAFNESSVSGGRIKLVIDNANVATWSDVYFKRMMVGQFDLAFGSISGNSLDPLNFMEVLKSDNSSGFTLNWGQDTSAPSETLTYDGKIWSFDTLWKAADSGVIIKDGIELAPINIQPVVSVTDEGSIVIVFKIQTVKYENTDVVIQDFSAYDGGSVEVGYSSVEVMPNGYCVVTLDGEAAEYFREMGGLYLVTYYSLNIDGMAAESYDMSVIQL